MAEGIDEDLDADRRTSVTAKCGARYGAPDEGRDHRDRGSDAFHVESWVERGVLAGEDASVGRRREE